MSQLALSSLLFLAAAAHAQPARMSAEAQRELVERYCAGCHNDRLKSGGFSLSELDLVHAEHSAPRAEKVVLKLRAGMMPPVGMPRPDRETVRRFVESLEAELDRDSAEHVNPGRPALHRLNRAEYGNSVHDLLDLDIDAAAYLPPDDMSHGFDNMAEVLNVSPALMAGYVRAAGKISRLAIGDAHASPVVETYAVPQAVSQTRHVDGTPEGTRGGIAIRHIFPADGKYIFKITLYFTTNTFLYGYTQKGEKLEVAVNGDRVALMDIDPLMKVDQDLRTPPIPVQAGPQTISVSFLKRADGPVDDLLMPYQRSIGDLFAGRTFGITALPHLRDLGIIGPYDPTGVSDTPSREKIFACRPENAAGEIPCARKILTALARQAYRRPVNDADMEDLLSLYQLGRNQGCFEGGIRLAVQELVADPQFVFRFERTPAGVAPGANYPVSDLELASRLSYFLWSRPPDEELLALASQQKLRRPGELERQVRRMLASPNSFALAQNFAGHWFQLQNLKDAQPDVFLFPNFDDNVLNSMQRETELLFDDMVREDRNVTDLLTADFTFVDERLAVHYGIPNVKGNRFRRVAVTDDNRRGLLGQASFLTLTSMANRTSPVLRGKWVMDVILGAPPPRPPANVPPLGENQGLQARSVRERLEEHRSNPTCAACHKLMDPIGFALEGFDATGAWRIKDENFAVDPTGVLFDGTPLNGPASLRSALLAHSDAFVRNFTVKLLTYALGRGTEYYDLPAVRQIDREAASAGDRFSAFVAGIVKSAPFQMRRADGPAPEISAAARSGGKAGFTR